MVGFRRSSRQEWTRRRRTAQFLGYNWLAATAIGVLFGVLSDMGSVSVAWLHKLCGIAAVFIAALVMLCNGVQAARECERVELLWVRQFFRIRPYKQRMKESATRE